MNSVLNKIGIKRFLTERNFGAIEIPLHLLVPLYSNYRFSF